MGTKRAVFTQRSTGLQLRVNTIGAAHLVALNGKISGTDRLQSYPVAGTLSATLTIDGRTQTQSIDVATNPPDKVKSSTGSEVFLQVHETEEFGASSVYKITFSTILDATRSTRIPNTNTTTTSSTSGSTFAEAVFTAPNKFGHWLLNNGYSLSDAHFSNEQGVRLAARFAFGYAADSEERFPWSFENVFDSPTLILRLPQSGLRKAIRIETCENLRDGVWETLSDSAFLDQYAGLEKEAAGLRRIRFPDSASRFYRIVADDLSH